jgi:WD40 repeat protein
MDDLTSRALEDDHSFMRSIVPNFCQLPVEVRNICHEYPTNDIPDLLFPKPLNFNTPKVTFEHSFISLSIFNNKGDMVLTANKFGIAFLWDLKGKKLAELHHEDEIRSAVFNHTDDIILTASIDGIIRLSDLRGNKLAAFNHDYVKSAIFNPPGDRILTRSFEEELQFEKIGSITHFAILWDLEGNKCAEFPHGSHINSAEFNQEGTIIITASEDHSVCLWHLDGTKKLHIAHDAPVEFATFNREENKIISFSKYYHTYSSYYIIRIWDLHGNQIHQFKHNSFGDLKLNKAKDLIVASIGQDHKDAILYDLNGNKLAQCIGHKGCMLTENFNEKSDLIVTGNEDREAIIWSITSKPLIKFKLPKAGITDTMSSVQFNQRGDQLLTRGNNHQARLWDIPHLKEASSLSEDQINLLRMLDQTKINAPKKSISLKEMCRTNKLNDSRMHDTVSKLTPALRKHLEASYDVKDMTFYSISKKERAQKTECQKNILAMSAFIVCSAYLLSSRMILSTNN